MVKSQTYPSTKIEWIVLDDGEPVGHLFEGVHVRYIYNDSKLTMGRKLNLLNKEAKGDIIIVFDDDDYYPPDRVSSVVEAFSKSKKEVAGTSLVYMYYTDTNEIYSTGPYSEGHALNCTLAYRSSYLRNHRYDDDETCAVEHGFLNDFQEPMIQLNPFKTILHIIHSSNTFDAINGRDEGKIGFMKKTGYTLNDFIKEPIQESFVNAY